MQVLEGKERKEGEGREIKNTTSNSATIYPNNIHLDVFVLFLLGALSGFGSDQKDLLVDLEDSYGPRSLRPVKNSSEVTEVVFRLLIAQLIDFVSITNLQNSFLT